MNTHFVFHHWIGPNQAAAADVDLTDFVHHLYYELVNKWLRLRCSLAHNHPPQQQPGAESPSAQDAGGSVHFRVHTPVGSVVNGLNQYKQTSCRYCAVVHGKRNVKTTWMCGHCGIGLCDEVKSGRPCFRLHINMTPDELKKRKNSKTKGA